MPPVTQQPNRQRLIERAGLLLCLTPGTMKTSIPSLQAYLDELHLLAEKNDVPAFVAAFVPLDLSSSDAKGFEDDLLRNGEEGEGQWRNLRAEVMAIAKGEGVEKIEGQEEAARAAAEPVVFFFVHPLLVDCDREVGFTCVDGKWRAEG